MPRLMRGMTGRAPRSLPQEERRPRRALLQDQLPASGSFWREPRHNLTAEQPGALQKMQRLSLRQRTPGPECRRTPERPGRPRRILPGKLPTLPLPKARGRQIRLRTRTQLPCAKSRLRLPERKSLPMPWRRLRQRTQRGQPPHLRAVPPCRQILRPGRIRQHQRTGEQPALKQSPQRAPGLLMQQSRGKRPQGEDVAFPEDHRVLHRKERLS